MAFTPKFPPIYQLNNDVLWHIFCFNTIPDHYFLNPDSYQASEESSTLTARWSSQVCQSWRSIILSSPKIWANSINMRHFSQKDSYWRDEVLKRTGGCSLSIIGNEITTEHPAASFLFFLLESHWICLRRIYLLIMDPSFSKDSRWKRLEIGESPTLEIFNMRFPRSFHAMQTTDNIFITPRLHTLIIHQFSFNLARPWNFNILNLKLIWISIGEDVIYALGQMSMLEHLSLEWCEIANLSAIKEVALSGKHNPTILPKLKFVYMQNDLDAITSVMAYFAPTPGCNYWIEAFSSHNGIDPLSCDLLQQTFTSHFKNLRPINDKIPEMSLALSRNQIAISNFIRVHSNGLPNPLFTYKINLVRQSACDVKSTLLKALTSCRLGSLSAIKLSFDGSRLNSSNSELTMKSFLSTLASIRTLHTDLSALDAISHAEERAADSLMLPNLATVVMEYSPCVVPEMVHRFLSIRSLKSAPIQTLDITNYDTFDTRFFESLLHYPNLKVKKTRIPRLRGALMHGS